MKKEETTKSQPPTEDVISTEETIVFTPKRIGFPLSRQTENNQRMICSQIVRRLDLNLKFKFLC